MNWIYCVCAVVAVVRIWRSPFFIFRYLLVASAISRAFWQASMSEGWWIRWIECAEPLVTMLMLLSVLEAGYYATTRMFPNDRRSISLIATLAGLVWALLAFHTHNTELGILVGLRTSLQSGIAVMALVGGLLIWWKSDPPCLTTRYHAVTLISFLSIEAAVEIVDRYIPQDDLYHWLLASLLFYCGWSICAAHWWFMPDVCAGESLRPHPSCSQLARR